MTLKRSSANLISVVPCIMLYSSEIRPTRCNNCVLFSAMALLCMFRVTISPLIRSTMLYMATGELAHSKLTNSVCYNNIFEHNNQLYYIS